MASRRQWQAPLGLAAWGDSDDEEVEPGYFVITTALWITSTVEAAEGTSTNNDNIVGLLDADVVVRVLEVVNVKKEKRIRGFVSSPQRGWISLKNTKTGFWWVERATSAQANPAPPAPVVRAREIRQPEPAPPPPAPKPAPPPAPVESGEQLPVMRNSLMLRRRGSARFSDDVSDHTFACGLRWRVHEVDGRQDPVDVDISALKFKKDGRYLGAVYFVDKDDAQNGIHHTGDEISGMTGDEDPGGETDSERILFKTSSFKPTLDVLLIVATIFSSGVQSFEEIDSFSCHILDTTTNKELCKYTKSDVGRGNAVVVGMIYRRGKRWAFKAIDECFTNPPHATARTLAQRGELAKFVREAAQEHAEAQAAGS